MKNFSSTDQDYNLWVLLNQTSDLILKARRKELGQYGILPVQAALLSVVKAIGHKAGLVDISQRLFREPNSVTCLVNRMEKAGLVRKSKGLGRKKIRVTLTKKGEQAYHQSIRQRSIRQIMASLSEVERQQLASSLQTLWDEATKRADGSD